MAVVIADPHVAGPTIYSILGSAPAIAVCAVLLPPFSFFHRDHSGHVVGLATALLLVSVCAGGSTPASWLGHDIAVVWLVGGVCEGGRSWGRSRDTGGRRSSRGWGR